MAALKYEYARLMEDFMRKDISTMDFVVAYLNKFKSETRELDEQEFYILDELFADIDHYTQDSSLIAEYPNLLIDENQLRERVAIAQMKLR